MYIGLEYCKLNHFGAFEKKGDLIIIYIYI